MRRQATILPALLMIATVAAAAQQSKAAAATTPASTVQKPSVEKARPEPQGQPVNMRIDLTIADQRGDAQPITKMVSITTSDRAWGRIRTQANVKMKPTLPWEQVTLNVDARPTLLRDNRARVELTVEYSPVGAEPDASERSTTPNVHESLSVILESGKPMVISQSADPMTDRTVKVEAKMTILRE